MPLPLGLRSGRERQVVQVHAHIAGAISAEQGVLFTPPEPGSYGIGRRIALPRRDSKS